MRKSKKLSILILITLFLVSMTPDKAEAKHFEFLSQIRFPVDHIKAHFYDDWKEKRGNGNRLHLGLDVRAPKGSKIVAKQIGRAHV